MSASQTAFLKFCKKKGINPVGQFAQQDGYLFHDGFEMGQKYADRRANKFMRLSREAARQDAEDRKALKHDCDVANSVINALSTQLAGLKEKLAETIYNQWSDDPRWVAWVPNGNSTMQDKARDMARKAFKS